MEQPYKPGTLLLVKECRNFLWQPHWSIYWHYLSGDHNKSKFIYVIKNDILMFVELLDAKKFVALDVKLKYIIAFLYEGKLIWDGVNDNHLIDIKESLEISI